MCVCPGNIKKIKDIQNESSLAPSTVKVDGRVREWEGFQAYNKSTHLYYTLANDDKNLYLVIKTSDLTTNAKITAGGITLSINTAGKKKEQDAYSLTYPIIPRSMGRPPGMATMSGGGAGGARIVNITVGGPGGSPGGAASGPDSAMVKAMHDRVINGAKEIKVSGFKDIQDSMIAIYNDYKIKAAIDYDKDNAFVYELAVPLKLMGLEAGDGKELAYNIKLNGLQLNFRMPEGGDGPPGGGFGGPGGGMRVMSFGGPGGGGPGRGGLIFRI
ncbi:hypothetical protein [Mucilaginibacter antarcticus]|uniref:hypothetical protein n=1 Tax=Mucilaginibacter antarcticus TaxID=1855725 RepID=UPI00364434FB